MKSGKNQWVVLAPNPGNDRTWTKQKWILASRFCRTMSPVVSEMMAPIAKTAMFELAMYGYTSIRLDGKNITPRLAVDEFGAPKGR